MLTLLNRNKRKLTTFLLVDHHLIFLPMVMRMHIKLMNTFGNWLILQQPTTQSKRRAAAGDEVGEQRNKRLRQNSNNTDSSTSSAVVPSDRSPINASYCSVQRYRTRVISSDVFNNNNNNNTKLYSAIMSLGSYSMSQKKCH